MTEEKHVAEWLRERSQLLRTLGEFSCRDFMTYEFGISSPCTHPRSCRDCYADMFERIADCIDLEMVELPRDADGEPIRVGDVLYSSGNECRVVSITVKADEACVGVHTDEGAFLPSVNPKYLSLKKPEPADSWEKLEEDARKTACNYAPAPRNEDGLVTCDGCRFQKSESCGNEMTLDVVERAKKLAGVEEEERND